MEPRISIITLGVTDLARSIRFYRDGLGFPTTVEAGAPIAFFMTAGTRFALCPLDRLAEFVGAPKPSTPGSFGGITLGHYVREKAEVDTVLALAAASGGCIAKPAGRVFWGGYTGLFTDPDGYYWEVAWAPMLKLDDLGVLQF